MSLYACLSPTPVCIRVGGRCCWMMRNTETRIPSITERAAVERRPQPQAPADPAPATQTERSKTWRGSSLLVSDIRHCCVRLGWRQPAVRPAETAAERATGSAACPPSIPTPATLHDDERGRRRPHGTAPTRQHQQQEFAGKPRACGRGGAHEHPPSLLSVQQNVRHPLSPLT